MYRCTNDPQRLQMFCYKTRTTVGAIAYAIVDCVVD